jgi:hypothetical protein
MEKLKYNHAFDLAFEVISKEENPENVTPPELLVGMLRRLANMVEEDFENNHVSSYMSVFLEATNCFDTHREGID